MMWAPILSAETVVDASRSNLNSLHIEMNSSGGRLTLKPPKRCFILGVSGNLSRFSGTGDTPSSLTLAPRTGRRKNDTPLLIPDLGELHQVMSLALHNAPLGQPISLAFLSRFPNLNSLHLRVNFCDMDLLARHSRLTDLELRFMPDLKGFPSLNVWPSLDSFIAYNVEEFEGKRLKQEMKTRAKTRSWAGMLR
ncbi:hypothetical protein GGC63_003310 [Paenibacillus sp. OAS669]|nr:hypothetical protein [Paenibacillus sp. OAS669]